MRHAHYLLPITHRWASPRLRWFDPSGGGTTRSLFYGVRDQHSNEKAAAEVSWTSSVSDSKAFHSNLELSSQPAKALPKPLAEKHLSSFSQPAGHLFSFGKTSESSHSFERTVHRIRRHRQVRIRHHRSLHGPSQERKRITALVIILSNSPTSVHIEQSCVPLLYDRSIFNPLPSPPFSSLYTPSLPLSSSLCPSLA